MATGNRRRPFDKIRGEQNGNVIDADGTHTSYERNPMVRYLALLKFTPSGAAKLDESTDRANTFQREAEAVGVQVESLFWCVDGVYDGVLILSAADDNAALGQLAALKRAGNVTLESCRLFQADEFDALVGSRKNE